MTSLTIVTEPGLRFSRAAEDQPAELELTELTNNRLHIRIDAQAIAAHFGLRVDQPFVCLVADGDSGDITAASYLIAPGEAVTSLRLAGTITDLPLHHHHPRQRVPAGFDGDDLADYIGRFIGAGQLHTAGVGYGLQHLDHRLVHQFLLAQIDDDGTFEFSYGDAGMVYVVAPTDGDLLLSSRWEAFGQFL